MAPSVRVDKGVLYVGSLEKLRETTEVGRPFVGRGKTIYVSKVAILALTAVVAGQTESEADELGVFVAVGRSREPRVRFVILRSSVNTLIMAAFADARGPHCRMGIAACFP